MSLRVIEIHFDSPQGHQAGGLHGVSYIAQHILAGGVERNESFGKSAKAFNVSIQEGVYR